MENEEKKRQEELKKPRNKSFVNQEWNDPLDLLAEYKKGQQGVALAVEASNVHAAFLQKAKERREKQEREEAAAAKALLEQQENKVSDSNNNNNNTVDRHSVKSKHHSNIPLLPKDKKPMMTCCIIS